MYTKNFVIIIILIGISAVSVSAEEAILGGPGGWNSFNLKETGIAGPENAAFMQLGYSEYHPTPDVEMLFHFNRGIYDATARYTVKRNTGVAISENAAKKGKGAAVFTGGDAFLELIPDGNAAFAAGSGRLNDFSIEFWMSPARLSEGETIIHWTGATGGEAPLRQEITCAVSGRNLFWEINNLFLTPELEPSSFRLESGRSLIPKRWHHHMLRYDSSTGLLEYLVDGIPEDITYTTREGKEEQEIYYPFVGAAKPATFVIGRGFTGFLDEIRISTAVADPELNNFSMNSGTAATEIIDLGFYDSRFTELKSQSSLEGRTQIYYYYRISNSYFQPGSEYPKWNQIEANTMLPPGIEGRYLQIMVELFPDGTGINTPKLREISVSYNENLPPFPPAYVSGRAENSKAVLNWKAVTDSDIAGYKIYYGDRPGMYFGADAAAGESPIDAGNTTSFEIDGLMNGKLYYFAVTSYDNAEIPHESVFSREISIRPSAIIRNE